MVYRVSVKLLKNQEDAEDNVQNTLLRAYQYISRFNNRSQFSTWLIRIAINEALMLLRSRNSRKEQITVGDTDNDVEMKLNVQDPNRDPELRYLNKELVSKALEGLPPILRTVFLMSKLEGWSNGELRECLGLSTQQLKQRVFRAKFILRRRVHRFSTDTRTIGCADPSL